VVLRRLPGRFRSAYIPNPFYLVPGLCVVRVPRVRVVIFPTLFRDDPLYSLRSASSGFG